MRTITTILIILTLATFAHADKAKILEDVSAGFNIPPGLLLTMCERESGPREDHKQILRPESLHDGGAGAGACGMKLSTAARILGRPVTRKDLTNVPFSAVISARYLTEKKWCGRWKRWEARVLCYRIGHNHRGVYKYRKTPWHKLPHTWGTYKIFKRWTELHGG